MENSSPVEHKPTVVPINNIVKETPKIRTIYTKAPKITSTTTPGQFIMVWVIGEDEIPMAVSTAEEDGTVSFSAEKIGDATTKLHKLEEGDLVGLRGPYGNGFDLSGEKLLMIGGGCGMAPLAITAERAVEKGKDVTVIISAESEEDLLFKSRIESLDAELLLGTEDGSAGVEGVTTDVLRQELPEEDYDSCLICGPERMMVATAEFIEERGIPLQISLNRYMKCGFGLCGSCSLDPSGLRVCEEGPVFTYEEIKDSEFGEYKRDAAGRKTEV